MRSKPGFCRFASRAAPIGLTARFSAQAHKRFKRRKRPSSTATPVAKATIAARYDRGNYQQLVRMVETNLTPTERITFLGSQWALARAGIATVGDFLNLAAAVRDDSSSFVIRTVSAALHTIDQQLASTPEEHEELARWVRKNFAPALARLGEPAAGDTPDRKLLRATLFLLLGEIGDDPRIMSKARQISEQYLRDPASVEGTLAVRVLDVAAQNGDAAFFDQLQRASQTSGDPQLRILALQALASNTGGGGGGPRSGCVLFYNMLVYFLCTLFQFVCCIKCNAGGRRPPALHFMQQTN